MLWERFTTGAILLLVGGAIFALGGIAVTAMAILVLCAVNYEFYAYAARFTRLESLLLSAGALIGPLGYLLVGPAAFAWGFVLAVLAAVSYEIIVTEIRADEGEPRLPRLALGLLYTGFIGSFLVLLSTVRVATWFIAWVVVVVVVTDIFAYVGGRLIGGWKLAPRISPKKTISGAIVGLVAAVAAGVLLGPLFGLQESKITLGAFAAILSIGAQLGDLLESLVKRIAHLKDMGSVLPGHGGVLDRVDGLILVSPIAFLFGPMIF